MIKAIIISLRPQQWTKNFLVFAGLIFSKNVSDLNSILSSIFAFVIFCLISGSTYIINDIIDIEKDKLHPLKSKRPLASGKLKKSTALGIAFSILMPSILLAFYFSPSFGGIVSGYAILTLSYSLYLKRIVIVDVIIIAIGFVLRALSGVVVLNVEISSWLLVCTIFLALFLALAKRRHELTSLGKDSSNHRKALSEYSVHLLDQMIAIVTASTVMAYALYTTADMTIQRFGTRNLVFTIPFVLYGIFRYLYLIHQKSLGGNPEKILLSDKPFIINVTLYIIVTILIIYV